MHCNNSLLWLVRACAVLQVRYARSHQYVQAGPGPEDNRQLFFARAPTSTTEEQLKELFGKYGEVRGPHSMQFVLEPPLQQPC